MKMWLTLLTSLPDIIRLLQVLQEQIEAAETNRKVKTDLRAIHEAIANKDADALNRLFANK